MSVTDEAQVCTSSNSVAISDVTASSSATRVPSRDAPDARCASLVQTRSSRSNRNDTASAFVSST